MASIKISELNPAGSNLSKDSESFMTVLSGKEVGNIQGGWLGAALGAAALGVAVYQTFTTEDERLLHRRAAVIGVKVAAKHYI